MHSDIYLPASSVYSLSAWSAHRDPQAHYLIETDPLFTSYRSWLSSDYMLQHLGVDPALTQKRLGDGYYEQRLVREQVAQLTGRRFLDEYTSDEQQYQALMNAGVAYAHPHGRCHRIRRVRRPAGRQQHRCGCCADRRQLQL